MAAGLFVAGDEASLLHDDVGWHIRVRISSLRGREDQHAILFGDIERAIRREADAVRDDEVDRRRECPHLVGQAILVPIGNGPHRVFGSADEHHPGGGSDRHLARARNNCIELHLEPGPQLDARNDPRQSLSVWASLGDDVRLRRAVRDRKPRQRSGAGCNGRAGREGDSDAQHHWRPERHFVSLDG